jgi:8-oxo-dGTP diphosphatase
MKYRHIGAYGLLERNGEVLVVRKNRGAYIGALDLPGGGIEFGEDPVAALRREFIEETGLSVIGETLIDALSNRVVYTTAPGEVEDLHHLGLIYRVIVADTAMIRTEPDGEDSDGALWVARDQMSSADITPFARAALDRIDG